MTTFAPTPTSTPTPATAAPRTGRVTLSDVADAVGLGRTTVSDILNRGAAGRYSEQTCEKVMQAVRKLGYAPSRAAQQLARGRSGQFGLLSTRDFSNPFFARMADFADKEVARRGMLLQVAVTGGDPQREHEQVQKLRGEQVEGVIVGPIYSVEEAQRHSAVFGQQTPMVVFGGVIQGHDSVVLDHYGAGVEVAEYLLRLGHRRITHLFTPDDSIQTSRSTTFAGLRDTLNTRGLYDERWVLPLDDQSDYQVYHTLATQFAQRWKQSSPDTRPTAVLCHNDQSAITVLSALHEANIRVPQDLSIVGFDNLPQSRYLIPPLTTVDTHIEQIMAAAVELLLWRIENPDEPARVRQVKTTLVTRASVAPPASPATPAKRTRAASVNKNQHPSHDSGQE